MMTTERRKEFGVMLSDLRMPGISGHELLLKGLELNPCLAVIMITGYGTVENAVKAIQEGAFDYVTKPFSPRELLARVRAILRRNHSASQQLASEVIQFGPFELDTVSQLLARGQEDVPLTSGEYALLKIFVEHPSRVLSRDALMDLLAGHDRAPFDRSIDVRVTRLRRKIEDDPGNPMYIRTVWGEGYRFSPN